MPQDKSHRPLVDGTLAARIRATGEAGSYDRLLRDFTQFQALRPQVNRLTGRLEKLKRDMKDYIDAHGELDARGHKVITFRNPVTLDEVNFTGVRNEARKSTYLDTGQAETDLRDLGIYDECTRTEITLDQDKIYDAYQRGLIPDEVLQRIFKTRTVWAFKADE